MTKKRFTAAESLERLEAAIQFWRKQQSMGGSYHAYFHPPDLFSIDPFAERPYVIPPTFIPDYIGGKIEIRTPKGDIVKDGGADETKEFMMSNFLPGGYKKRWNFGTYRAIWVPSELHKRHANITGNFSKPEKVPFAEIYTSGETFSKFQIPVSETDIYLPKNMLVEPIPNILKFFWNEELYFLDYKDTDGESVGQRDPLSVSLWENIILTKDEPNALPYSTLIESISYYPVFEFCKCYYANVLQMFPQRNPITRTIRFADDKSGKYAVIGIKEKSQAVRFKIHLKILTDKLNTVFEKYPSLKKDLEWKYLSMRLSESVVFERRCAESTYDIESILTFLYAVDNWLRNKSSEMTLFTFLLGEEEEQKRILSELIPEDKIIRLRLFGFDSQKRDELFEWIQRSGSDVCDILTEITDENTYTKHLQHVIAETFIRALKLAVHQRFAGISEGLVFWYNPHIVDDYLDIYAYDKYEGGSGIAHELYDKLQVEREHGTTTLQKSLEQVLHCNVGIVSDIIENLFLQYDADYLWAVFREKSEAANVLLHTEIVRIEKLYSLIAEQKDELVNSIKLEIQKYLQTKELTAFYKELFTNYKELNEMLGRSPQLVDLVLYTSSMTFYDPRAARMFDYYRQMKHGNRSEVSIRISEMMPTCVDGCPECLLGEENVGVVINPGDVVDKRLLHLLLEEAI